MALCFLVNKLFFSKCVYVAEFGLKFPINVMGWGGCEEASNPPTSSVATVSTKKNQCCV